MAEPLYGDDFVRHEFDEAIAIQKAIVEGGRQLGDVHPDRDSKRLIERGIKEDERLLRALQRLGEPYGATGEVEEIAGAMQQLMRESAERAAEAESEAYEAHAVLLTLKRKQQDSAQSIIKIARERNERDLREAASEFQKSQKASAQELADTLAAFAVTIASKEPSQV